MHSRILTIAVVFILASLCQSVLAAAQKEYSLGDAGMLKVALPDGWTGDSDGQSPPTIQLKSPQGKHVSIQITAMPGPSTDAKLKDTAQAIGDQLAKGSREKKTILEEVKGKDIRGYVSSFTDASEEAGEFRYVTAGVVSCNKQTLAVTLLYNDKTSVDHTAALAALKTFSVSAPLPAAKDLRVKSPDGTWTLVLPGQWKVSEDSKGPDGKSREVTAMSVDGDMMLTLFFEPAENPGSDAKTAREFYLERMEKNPMGMEHLQQNSIGEIATLEYDQGTTGFKQHNLNAYLTHAGIWVDVHVSKPDFNEKTDRATIDAIVNGLKQE